jgi:membrane fusion protein, heavy metal efflux system
MKKNNFVLSILFSYLTLLNTAFAHEGHDHAPGSDDDASSQGPVVITAEAKSNLDLITKEAEIRNLDNVIKVIGRVVSIPKHTTVITSRIAGKVLSLKVADGESVKNGQDLIEIESRQLGDPPPKVVYKSPIDGIIIDKQAELGASVESEKHLLRIANLNEVFIESKIFEGQLANVRIGQKARVTVESFPNEVLDGTIDVISGSLDPETRALTVWIKIPNPSLKLRPNMQASISVITGQTEAAITIPKSSILGEEGNDFVFVQSSDNELEFRRQAIVIGIRDDQFVEIIEGILPGDKVVTAGNYQLQYIKPTSKESKDDHLDEPNALSNTNKTSFAIYALLFISILINIILLIQRNKKV